jgi:hypothetical protein
MENYFARCGGRAQREMSLRLKPISSREAVRQEELASLAVWLPCSPLNLTMISPRAALLLLASAFFLTSCQSIRDRFTQPAPDWQSRVGQLQYHGPKTSIIGEVLVRYSSAGDFELTFSKGPGIILLTVRQNDKFVRVSGPLARGSWSGSPEHAPVHLRGWVSLREALLRSRGEALVRQNVGTDHFTFAF